MSRDLGWLSSSLRSALREWMATAPKGRVSLIYSERFFDIVFDKENIHALNGSRATRSFSRRRCS